MIHASEGDFQPAESKSPRPPVDFYDILGVSRNATANEIEKAYRDSLIKCHPDKFAARPGSEEAKHAAGMLEIVKNAYDALSNPRSKTEYDARIKYVDKERFDSRSTSKPASRAPESEPAGDPDNVLVELLYKATKRLILSSKTIADVQKKIHEYNLARKNHSGPLTRKYADFKVSVNGKDYEVVHRPGTGELELKEVK